MERPSITLEDGTVLELRKWPLRRTREFAREFTTIMRTALAKVDPARPWLVSVPDFVEELFAERHAATVDAMFISGLKLPAGRQDEILGMLSGDDLKTVLLHNLSFLMSLGVAMGIALPRPLPTPISGISPSRSPK